MVPMELVVAAMISHTISNKRATGFSLIDLLIVMAILAVLGTASYPVYTRLAQLSLFKSEIRALKSTIRYASEQAIMNNRLYAITFEGSSYFISVEIDPLKQPGELQKVKPQILNKLSPQIVFKNIAIDAHGVKMPLFNAH